MVMFVPANLLIRAASRRNSGPWDSTVVQYQYDYLMRLCMNDLVGAYRGYQSDVLQTVVHGSSHAIAGTTTKKQYQCMPLTLV
jgi:hypothetical protein